MSANPEIVQSRETPATALARIDPQALIAQAITAGAGIEMMERLVALAKDVREMAAREAWYEAMAAFQAECPAIYKTKTAQIKTRTGSGYSYKFAPLDEIKPKVDPILGKHGLSARWTSPVIDKEKVTVECVVAHALGHAESSGAVTMPILGGQEDTGANPMQRVAIAMTYAKRYSLLNILGLAPEEDDDGEKSERGTEAGGQGEQGGASDGAALINEGQVRKFYAIARGTKPTGWTDEQITKLLNDHKHEHVKDITAREYDDILQVLKAGPPKPAASAAPTQEKLA